MVLLSMKGLAVGALVGCASLVLGVDTGDTFCNQVSHQAKRPFLKFRTLQTTGAECGLTLVHVRGRCSLG